MDPLARWKATLVHGNDDIQETVEDTYIDALNWARDEERKRGHSFVDLRAQFHTGSEEAGSSQYGTNYHYAVLEEIK